MADRVTAEYTFNDMSDKKSTKNLPYLSTSATDNQIKALVEGLNGLTTNTLLEINRVETTDITNGGLETVGYSLRYGDSTDFVPGVIYPADENGKSLTHTLYLVSSTGTDAQSGATDATFSGKKPKGCTITFANGMIRFQFSGVNYKDGETYHRFAIHVTTTGKAPETLYLYFVADEEDMEAI